MRFSKGYNVVFLIEYLIFAIVDGQHTEKAGGGFKQFVLGKTQNYIVGSDSKM